MTKEEYYEKNGFDNNGTTYCVVGEDTYFIKDKLKECDFTYSPLLGWHSATIIDLPAGYQYATFTFDTLASWDEERETVCFKEEANQIVNKEIKSILGPDKSEYVGEVGDRLRHVTAVYKSTKGYSSPYGWKNIHTFTIGDNILTWFTEVELDLERGVTIDLSATIKKHDLYRETKTTIVSRCIVKPIV